MTFSNLKENQVACKIAKFSNTKENKMKMTLRECNKPSPSSGGKYCVGSDQVSIFSTFYEHILRRYPFAKKSLKPN
jgi:hypothetical protein